MDENSINIINTRYHKHMTDRHLAQVNFTAEMPSGLWDKYIEKTNVAHENLGRIRFMQIVRWEGSSKPVLVWGRVSHGYGYDIAQDIFNAIMDAKGVTK